VEGSTFGSPPGGAGAATPGPGELPTRPDGAGADGCGGAGASKQEAFLAPLTAESEYVT
jgi:hypothetical protein